MARQDLLGKVAIVTGASGGIGRATALELARAGAHLVLASRNVQTLDRVCREVEALGREAIAIPTDVERPEQVQSMVMETVARWGHVDILVVNAGTYYRTPIADLTIAVLEASMAVNFYGGVHAILAVLPKMLKQKSGHIVHVSTLDVYVTLPGDVPYVAAKSALSGFTDVLRQELHGSGVTVTSVYPGRVQTPMIQDLKLPWISSIIPPEAVARAILSAIRRREPVVILPFPAEILYFVRFFSTRLSDWITRIFHLQGWQAEAAHKSPPDSRPEERISGR